LKGEGQLLSGIVRPQLLIKKQVGVRPLRVRVSVVAFVFHSLGSQGTQRRIYNERNTK